MKILTPVSLLVLSILLSTVPNDRAIAQIEKIQSSPAVGSIKTRDRQIMIGANATYTILSHDGKILFENVTLEQLQAKNPDLSEAIEESIAQQTMMMDARIGDRWHQQK
jgi:hypothetical protein